MNERTRITVLIMAAGQGLRAANNHGLHDKTVLPKQYRLFAGYSVIARTLTAFLNHDEVDFVQSVIAAGDEMRFEDVTTRLSNHRAHNKLTTPVCGGSTRQASVLAGLEALAVRDFRGIVMVHDAARPFVSDALISRAIEAARISQAAVPVLAISDTIKTVDKNGQVTGTLPRAGLATVQTPQSFVFDALLAAHRKAHHAGINTMTDDAAVMEWSGVAVSTFAGEPGNVKLTVPEDFALAEARLSQHFITRIGQGYDVHRFMAGDHVWIGGIRIAHRQGVEAHSDGDVVLHALTDALLGALAEGDIGVHFSQKDPRWRAASSDQFLAFAAMRVQERGGRIDHLDTTVVCEEPKITPHREIIRRRIAEICHIDLDQVSIKATTSEQMGFAGRCEGLSA